MEKILIVSKTRMRDNRVCVGGIDMGNKKSIRLFDERGHHETLDKCPYNIGDLWSCDYIRNHYRQAPFTEDSNILSRVLVERGYCETTSEFLCTLRFCDIMIFTGPLTSCFGHCLKAANSSYYISKDSIPQYSTCFWISDHELKFVTDTYGKEKFLYRDDSLKYITYVGVKKATSITPGSLVRLSLANWWAQTPQAESRCYLQVSGVY